ncbi:hypothetical protein, partial [Pseudomonas syringae]
MNNRYFAFSNGSSALSVEKNPQSPPKAYVGAMQDVERAGLTAGKNQACPSCNQVIRQSGNQAIRQSGNQAIRQSG